MTGPARRLVGLVPGARRPSPGPPGVVAAGLAGVVQAGLLADLVAGAFLGGAGLARSAPALLALTGVVGARAGLGWAAEVAAQRCGSRVVARFGAGCSTRSCCSGPRHPGAALYRPAGGARRPGGRRARRVRRPVPAAERRRHRRPGVVWLRVLSVDWLSGLLLAVTVPLVPVFMVLIGLHTRQRVARQWRTLDRPRRSFLDVVAGLDVLTAFGRARSQSRRIAAVSERHRAETMRSLRVGVPVRAHPGAAGQPVGRPGGGVGRACGWSPGNWTWPPGCWSSCWRRSSSCRCARWPRPTTTTPRARLPPSRCWPCWTAAPGRRCRAASPTPPPDRSGSRPSRSAGRGGPVLDGLSLTVEPGQVLGLTGASGAGKSTRAGPAARLAAARPRRGDRRRGRPGPVDRTAGCSRSPGCRSGRCLCTARWRTTCGWPSRTRARPPGRRRRGRRAGPAADDAGAGAGAGAVHRAAAPGRARPGAARRPPAAAARRAHRGPGRRHRGRPARHPARGARRPHRRAGQPPARRPRPLRPGGRACPGRPPAGPQPADRGRRRAGTRRSPDCRETSPPPCRAAAGAGPPGCGTCSARSRPHRRRIAVAVATAGGRVGVQPRARGDLGVADLRRRAAAAGALPDGRHRRRAHLRAGQGGPAVRGAAGLARRRAAGARDPPGPAVAGARPPGPGRDRAAALRRTAGPAGRRRGRPAGPRRARARAGDLGRRRRGRRRRRSRPAGPRRQGWRSRWDCSAPGCWPRCSPGGSSAGRAAGRRSSPPGWSPAWSSCSTPRRTCSRSARRGAGGRRWPRSRPS